MPQEMPFGIEPEFTKKATEVDPREWEDFKADHEAEKLKIFGRPLSEVGKPKIVSPEYKMLTKEQLDSLDGHDEETQKRMIERYKRQNLENAN